MCPQSQLGLLTGADSLLASSRAKYSLFATLLFSTKKNYTLDNEDTLA